MKIDFKKQVDLLLDVIKHAVIPRKFALKGGTAINLFLNDMPRLSIDIDLAYLVLNNREEAILDIKDAVKQIISKIKTHYPSTICNVKATNDGFPSKIQVIRDRVEIKIEINNVFRGAVYPSVKLELCNKAQDLFEKYVEIDALSLEELYAGKFCAALDRQHPRDLFDVRIFFEKYEFSEKLKDVFIVYLLSSGRPIVELLQPNYLNQESVYEKELVGMASDLVTYNVLEDSRKKLVDLINSNLHEADKNFLISFESGEPDWKLFKIKNIEYFPSIKWRLHNLRKMDKVKKRLFIEKLLKLWE